MSLQLRLSRTVEAISTDRLWPELLRLAAFVAVEGLAELCRLHLLATSDLRVGWATAPVVASLALGWAYLAHQRLAFRGRAPIGRLLGAGVFVVLSLGCLDGELLVSRLTSIGVVAVWPAATALKFVLVRRLVWPGRRAGLGVLP